jgi:hypothetical protein
MQVFKLSGNPFKSKIKINTVKDIINHPKRDGYKAYIFFEDDSFVSVDQCEIYENDEKMNLTLKAYKDNLL